MPDLTFCAATSSIGINEPPWRVQWVYTSINLCRTRGLDSVWMKQDSAVGYKAMGYKGEDYEMASTGV